MRRLPWVVLFLLLPAGMAFAVDKTWVGTAGDWATGSNWIPAGVPGATDRAIIPAGGLPTINATPATINQLVVNGAATLTIVSGADLNIDGGVSPFIDGTGTVVTVGTGRIVSTAGVNNGTLINDSMTLGNLTMNPAGGPTFIIAAGKTVTLNGNLTLQQGRLRVGVNGQAAVTLNITGTLSIPTGTTFDIRSNNSTIRVGGNWVQTGRWLGGTNSTVIFNGTAAQNIDIDRRQVASFDFENLRISNTSAQVTYLNNNPANTPNGLNVNGNLTVDALANFVVQDYAVIGNAAADLFGIGSGATVTFQSEFNPNCTISFDIDAGGDDGSLVLQGTIYPPNDATSFGYALIPGHGNVVLQFTGDGTFPLATGGPYTFWNLVLETGLGGGQVGTNVVTVNSGFTVQNNLVLKQGQLSVPAVTVAVNGTVDSSDARNSQLDFTGTGTLQVKGNVDLDTFSQVNSGTGGPFSTILMNGTSPQTFQIRATTASQFHDLDNFRVSNTTGVLVLDNPNSDFIVGGTLTIDTNALLTVRDTFDADGPVVFAGAGGTLRLEGPVVADASVIGSTLTAGTGTVAYGGNGLAQTVYARSNGTSIPYYNLTIDNTGALATQEATGLLTVNGSFTILGATSSFRAGAGNMTVARDFISNGTFDPQTYTVTMAGVGTGAGNIGGTSASLTFNNLLVNGPTTWAVTAARTFTVSSTFQVLQGLLTTAGAAAPITMNASLGFTAGDGAGGAGTAIVNLTGADTLAIATGLTFTVSGTDGLFSANSNSNGTPTLTRIGGAGSFSTMVDGQVNIRKLNFSFGDAQGLRINNATAASIIRLSGVTFSGILPFAGSRHLTINSAGIDLDCPGCIFGAVPALSFNVWAVDTVPGGTPVRIRFENRGVAPAAGGGGPGAGEAFDGDDDTNDNGIIDGLETTVAHGGAIVQWVYAANIDMGGSVQGFPAPAFDWNSFAYYSTYIIMRNVSAGTDVIYVLNEEGDLKNYSFSLPNVDIVGPLFWDTEGANHVVYFGANDPTGGGTGYIYKLIDNGSTLAQAPAPWNTPFTSASLNEVTSAVVSDQTNVYFGGRNAGTNGVYKVPIATKAVVAPLSTTSLRISTAPSWTVSGTSTMLFFASQVSGGTSRIYRVNGTGWSVDTSFTDTTNPAVATDCQSDFVGITNLPGSILYVGETNGWMHALKALDSPWSATSVVTGYPFQDSGSAIRGGAVFDFGTSRLFFGNDNGDIYTLLGYTAPSWTLGADYYRTTPLPAVPVRTMPLFQSGVLYVSNTGGQLFVIDANNGTGQTLQRTWNLSNGPLSDVSRDFWTQRIYVGTATGRLLSVPEDADVTSGTP